ncbi:hypothetical protein ACJZ2D_013318 [Fusarium nematophilum]
MLVEKVKCFSQWVLERLVGYPNLQFRADPGQILKEATVFWNNIPPKTRGDITKSSGIRWKVTFVDRATTAPDHGQATAPDQGQATAPQPTDAVTTPDQITVDQEVLDNLKTWERSPKELLKQPSVDPEKENLKTYIEAVEETDGRNPFKMRYTKCAERFPTNESPERRTRLDELESRGIRSTAEQCQQAGIAIKLYLEELHQCWPKPPEAAIDANTNAYRRRTARNKARKAAQRKSQREARAWTVTTGQIGNVRGGTESGSRGEDFQQPSPTPEPRQVQEVSNSQQPLQGSEAGLPHQPASSPPPNITIMEGVLATSTSIPPAVPVQQDQSSPRTRPPVPMAAEVTGLQTGVSTNPRPSWESSRENAESRDHDALGCTYSLQAPQDSISGLLPLPLASSEMVNRRLLATLPTSPDTAPVQWHPLPQSPGPYSDWALPQNGSQERPDHNTDTGLAGHNETEGADGSMNQGHCIVTNDQDQGTPSDAMVWNMIDRMGHDNEYLELFLRSPTGLTP